MNSYTINGQAVTEQELWDGVLGSGAIQAWDWWRGVVFEDGASWETPGIVKVFAYDESGAAIAPKRIAVADLVHAANKVARIDRKLGTNVFAITNLDADTADLVLQVAVFGEVIYS